MNVHFITLKITTASSLPAEVLEAALAPLGEVEITQLAALKTRRLTSACTEYLWVVLEAGNAATLRVQGAAQMISADTLTALRSHSVVDRYVGPLNVASEYPDDDQITDAALAATAALGLAVCGKDQFSATRYAAGSQVMLRLRMKPSVAEALCLPTRSFANESLQEA